MWHTSRDGEEDGREREEGEMKEREGRTERERQSELTGLGTHALLRQRKKKCRRETEAAGGSRRK